MPEPKSIPCPECGKSLCMGCSWELRERGTEPDPACPDCARSCMCKGKGTIPDRRKPLADDRPDAPIIHAIASLAAAVSLLENSPKTGAPSNKMFDIMLDDYRKSLEDARNYAREHIVQRSPTDNDRAVERIKRMLDKAEADNFATQWEQGRIAGLQLAVGAIHEEEERDA